MNKIEKLYGVNNIEVDTQEGKLFIEKEKDDGVEIDVTQEELMHLLGEYTELEYGPKEIYGFKKPEWMD